ncbi:VOC family protein [Rhodanobacter hydrolyticus]|uniref:VOC family protein n=1 Tax=Rhodanobacter hydrolyticus TaxID=2250595 RepID=A0ABW8J867_9GAMM
MTQYIASFALVVADYDEAVAYYTRVLGFELREDSQRENGKRWVLVAPPGAATSILLAKATTDLQATRIGNQTGGRVGFFLHTDNFEHDFAAMKSRGVRFAEAPRHEDYGTVAVFEDIYGNRWDLLQLKP